ncbi:MAG: hypothetical protein VX223_07515 [Myxococcota bacterium]|nr:hypothetical protein [Myxococcota bacterium]
MITKEFRGFAPPPYADFHAALSVMDQCRRYLNALVPRLGHRIIRPAFTTGRDTRGGRDYFFEQVEFIVRGRPDRSFMGFYHYGPSAMNPGTFFEVWEHEAEPEPCWQRGLDALAEEVTEAWNFGRLSDWLDSEAQRIRHALDV